MSKQLTVRLADELVDFIDGRIKDGMAPSRAAVIGAAIERERRRALAERDAAILAKTGGGDDLNGLAAYGARVQLTDIG
jgi:Arc/MetJ-type ribon-helix-helix transcriptional regulator